MGNSTKELVNAFNLNNYFSDKINTNFTVEGKKIVGLFASSTNTKEYLREIGEEIIKQQYGTKEVASRYYNLNCFPFVLGANPDKEYVSNSIVKVKLADSTNNEVIRNLKVHFANEFKRAVKSKVVARLQKAGITKEGASEWVIGTVKIGVIGSPYLYCIAFSDEYLKRECDSETFEVLKGVYIQEFNSRLKECGLKSSGFYEYKDDMLYIKDVSDKVVKSVAEYVKKEVAFDFRTPGSVEYKVENCKNILSDLILRFAGRFVDAYDYDTFIDENKIKNGHSFALIPFIEMDDGQFETLSSRDASKINKVFNGFHCISDIRGKTANPQFANCKEPVYAFSNKQIALLLPIIMQSSIAYNEISGSFEFAIDLENFKRRGSSRSSSTVTSPFNSLTHAGPSGLETPPNPRKGNRDSGIGESPLKLEDFGVQSQVRVPNGPSSSLTKSLTTQEFPARSQGEELGGSPRKGSEKEELLFNPVNLAGTSKGFSPRSHLNSIAVSYGVSGPSSSLQSVGAAQNVRAGTSAWDQPIGAWSSPAPSAEPSLWQPSRPSSWKGANPVEVNPWVQQTNYWSLQSSNLKEDCKEAYEKIVSDSSLSKEEQELFEALLYWFNLNNYALDPPHTNFIVKNGKIASLIGDSVDVKEYLQEVTDKTKEEYCVNKKEAYDLNEFPFKFLSNCEKNQETTVVANISRGALLNLKELFSQEYEGKVEIKDIDINIVKKAVKSEKDEWVNFQVREHRLSPKAAIKTCCPDESALEYISITKGEGGHWIDRDYDASEVKSFSKERWPAKGTSKAEKMKSEDNKDSGYSSRFVTDAESVSSKAEATTSGLSGYESMDCENTRGGSPKRTLELSMGMEELAISTISTDLDATKVEQHSSIKKFRRN
ncbi:hypothetical protein [Wolbachia endosymbiont (group B) of Limnophora tigrina]|uniref:hypothetical protein n=1 Tax=Wolbachia endosymbiont (group B) of Limnophora tigrina TaxID=3139317 RepID=UPI0035B56EF8